jgi:hypothetical protein
MAAAMNGDGQHVLASTALHNNHLCVAKQEYTGLGLASCLAQHSLQILAPLGGRVALGDLHLSQTV